LLTFDAQFLYILDPEYSSSIGRFLSRQLTAAFKLTNKLRRAVQQLRCAAASYDFTTHQL
jgi:hypothetical protein